MAIIIVDHKLTKDDAKSVREEYKNFIKITVDIEKGIMLID